MLFMVIVLTPFYIIYFILSSSHLVSVGMRKPLTLITWCAYFYIFWKLGDPFPILSPKHGILSIEQGKSLSFITFYSTIKHIFLRHKSSWCDRGDHYGSFVWIWCSQLPLHKHERVYEERFPGGRQEDWEVVVTDHGDDRHEEKEDCPGGER